MNTTYSQKPGPAHPVRTIIQRERQRRSMSPSALARQIGWAPNRGAEQIRRIEAGEYLFPSDDELQELAAGLALNPDLLQAARDREFNHLDSQEFCPFLVVFLQPPYYIVTREELPPDLDSETRMADHASNYAQRSGKKVCLVLSPVRGIYVTPDGTRSHTHTPPEVNRDLDATWTQPKQSE